MSQDTEKNTLKEIWENHKTPIIIGLVGLGGLAFWKRKEIGKAVGLGDWIDDEIENYVNEDHRNKQLWNNFSGEQLRAIQSERYAIKWREYDEESWETDKWYDELRNEYDFWDYQIRDILNYLKANNGKLSKEGLEINLKALERAKNEKRNAKELLLRYY